MREGLCSLLLQLSIRDSIAERSEDIEAREKEVSLTLTVTLDLLQLQSRFALLSLKLDFGCN